MPQGGQFTPNLVAEGDIRPYRFVSAGTADNGCVEANANGQCLGVTNGSSNSPYSDLHAASGETARLQPGDVIQVEAGAAIAVGARVISDADGKAVAAATSGTVNQEVAGVAMQAAGADTDIIRLLFRPEVVRPAIV